MFSSRKTASMRVRVSSVASSEPTICKHAFLATIKLQQRHLQRVFPLLLSLLFLFFYLRIIFDDGGGFRVQHALPQALAATTLDLNELPEEAVAEDEEETVESNGTASSESLSEQAKKLAVEEKSDDGDKCEDQNGSEKGAQQASHTDTWWGRLKCQTSGTLKTSQCTLTQLPKYFDFEFFKRQFKRTYSKSEALFRKSIFLKRCFQVFKSRLAYRLGLTNYIQGVNKFADRSNGELKRMFMIGPPIELRPNGQSKEEYLRLIKQREEEREEVEQAGLFAEFESQSSVLSTNDLNHLDTNELNFVNFDSLVLNESQLNKRGSDEEDSNSNSNDLKKENEEQQSATTIIHECKLKKKIQHLVANTKDEELLKAIQDEIYDFKIETFSQTSGNSFNCETKPLPKLFKYKIVDSYDDDEQQQQQLDNNNDNGDDNDNDYQGDKSVGKEEASRGYNKRKRVFNLDLNKLEEEQDDLNFDSDSDSDLDLNQGKGKQLKFSSSQNNNSENMESTTHNYQAPQLEDECDSLDWSKHDCFHQIYDQGTKCGRCYVMASTSLAEFYKCNENETKLERRKFSKDYVLNCGQKYSPTTILGCLGGSLLDTLKFISLAGVYNIRNWKLKLDTELKKLKSPLTSSVSASASVGGVSRNDLDLKCPFNQYDTNFNEWGQIKLNVKPLIVHTINWFRMLKEGPIVVSIQMPFVETYESGVHDGNGCETSGNWHSMLLVGYGMNERRIPYWLFRNSWGENWGEGGHFKLAMSVSGKCLAGGVRLIYLNKLPAELA